VHCSRLGLPDTELRSRPFLEPLKTAVSPGSIPRGDDRFSPYNAGVLSSHLACLRRTIRLLWSDKSLRQMDERLQTHFPDADGRSLNDMGEHAVIGTTRVLQAYVALGGPPATPFPAPHSGGCLRSDTDGGFGLNEGDFSRMFSTSWLPNCSRQSVVIRRVQKIARFVMDTYDGTTGCWGVPRGEKARIQVWLARSRMRSRYRPGRCLTGAGGV